jgi:putative peptidoglycan lipid II flippase
MTVLLEFLVHPLQQASFPHFTKLCARRDFDTLSPQLFRYLRIVFFVTLPAAIGIMMTAGPIVQAIYQRGAFDENAVALTSQALFFYAIGFPAYAIARIFRGTYFGLKDTWTPTKISLGCIGIKIVVAWLLVGPMAHRGIALADSISQIINVVLLFCFLPQEVRGDEGWKTAKAFAQTMAACLAMGAVVYFAQERIYGLYGPILELGSVVLLGVAVYCAAALLLRMEASQSVLKAVTELGGKYFRGVSKAI